MAKILVVDDTQTELSIMKQIASSAGHTCVTAMDGNAALTLAAKERPDMILLDVVMPGVDGFAVCRKLRKAEETKNTPIILVSSKNQESDRFWGIKQGANDYLTKPFQPAELQALISKYLKK